MEIKLQDALLDAAHEVKRMRSPYISDIEVAAADFLLAYEKGDMSKQDKCIGRLIAILIKWRIENL